MFFVIAILTMIVGVALYALAAELYNRRLDREIPFSLDWIDEYIGR